MMVQLFRRREATPRPTGAVVMDGQTIWTEAYKRFGGPPPMSRVLAAVTADLRVVSQVACLARRPESSGTMSTLLRQCGMEVRERLVNREADGRYGKSNVDAEVSFALAEVPERVSVVVAMLGDADFADALRRLHDRGHRLRVVCYRGSLARAVRHLADEVVFIEDLVAVPAPMPVPAW